MRFLTIVAAALFTLFAASPAFAAEAAEAAASGGTNWALGIACLGMGFASAGGAFGQSRACSTALEGMARNPGAGGQLFTPMILGFAFMESLVLLTWLVVFLKF